MPAHFCRATRGQLLLTSSIHAGAHPARVFCVIWMTQKTARSRAAFLPPGF
ncbi:hypothetical protein BRYFOR_09915 [Marvinbryantia formatexigens DSM 14469]|uniref:Uncharacterized protein n=1 Tax=Marvinbryantia formatexigens DSM 14469 TaxID=478749 RepID=C6LML4_9FIRM|nr:hypothetical protein BRYFOR_09915 [Marvinbryantia formatexigens DSM 14469]